MDKVKCPEIRFEGFSGDWEEKKLGDVMDYKNGKGHENKQKSFGKFELVNLNSISIDGGLKPSGKFIDEADITLEKNDLVMVLSDVAHGNLLGRVAIIPENNLYVLNQRVALLRPNNDIHSLFILYNINAHQLYFKSQGAGMSQLNISRGCVESFSLFLPNKKEQTAIGNFFQQLDQSIVLQQQKYTQTQNLKKAMLEKMFPKAGSKQPEIRIKGFGGNWENFRIFDIAQNKKLNNGVFNDQAKVGKGYKLINVLDMYIESDINEDNLSLLDLERKEFELNKVKYGDVFFTRSSLVKEGIAFSNVYLGGSDDITYDGHLIKLSPNFELVNPIFLNYCLKTSKIRTQLILGGKSTTMTTIGQQEVGNTIVDIPTLEEQTAIGQFFKQLDDTLALQQQQLQTLKNLKQAFLAKMFV